MNQRTLKPLKPCPFCGGEAMFVLTEKDSSLFGIGFKFEICCQKGGARLPKQYKMELRLHRNGDVKFTRDDREVAVSEWNMRS